MPLWRLLHAAGITEPTEDAQYVCFRGPTGELPKGKDGSYGTSIPMHMALDPGCDVMIAYEHVRGLASGGSTHSARLPDDPCFGTDAAVAARHSPLAIRARAELRSAHPRPRLPGAADRARLDRWAHDQVAG